MSTFVAAVRSLAAYLAVSLYVAIAAPSAWRSRSRSGGKACSTFWGTGVWPSEPHSPASARESRAASMCRRAVPWSSAATIKATSTRRSCSRLYTPGCTCCSSASSPGCRCSGRAFQIGGFVPIDRQSREQSMAAIEQAAESLRQGNSFLTFPEGTRSRTGALLPFKRGPFLDGAESPGAGRPRRDSGRNGVDEERQSDRPAGHGQRANRRASRDSRNGPFGSRAACSNRAYQSRGVAGPRTCHLSPGLCRASRRWTVSRRRLTFVSCCFAESTQMTYRRRYDGASVSKKSQARGWRLSSCSM